MLSYTYNYGMFSNIAYTGGQFDKQTLLTKPADVTNDGYAAIASAMWFYMTPVPPKPSMHEVTTGLYTPNAYDTS